MAGFRYLWIVETRAGKWRFNVTKGKKGPMPDSDGFITLDKKKYAVDPRRFRDWTFRLSKWKRKRYYRVQLWKENDPQSLNFFHVDTPDPRFSSEMIATAMRAKKIREVIPSEGFDIIQIALIMSLIGNIAIILWLISQVKFT